MGNFSRKARRAFFGPFSPIRAPNPFFRRRQPKPTPILLTGHARSGSSWIGQTIAQAPEAVYYDEPCSPNHWNGERFEWFRYVRPGTPDPYLERALDPVFRGLVTPGWTLSRSQYARRWSRSAQLVITEVTAIMSADWVWQRYQPLTLLAVRHPAAIAWSELRRDIDARESVQAFLSQPALMEAHLEPYRAVLEEAQEPCELYGAVWGARNRVLVDCLEKHPGWQIVDYDSVARSPVEEFQRLYKNLGLTWSSEIAEHVRRTTTTNQSGVNSNVRVSSERVELWRQKLSTEQIAQVRQFSTPFQLPFDYAW